MRVNPSQILHFKRQLRVLRFLQPLKSQIALSNLNHPGSSPSPQTHAVHYISAEIHCSLVQRCLWSPWELICTPASEGVSPGQLAGDRKAEIHPRGHRCLSGDSFFFPPWVSRNLRNSPQNKGLHPEALTWPEGLLSMSGDVEWDVSHCPAGMGHESFGKKYKSFKKALKMVLAAFWYNRAGRNKGELAGGWLPTKLCRILAFRSTVTPQVHPPASPFPCPAPLPLSQGCPDPAPPAPTPSVPHPSPFPPPFLGTTNAFPKKVGKWFYCHRTEV